MSIHLIRHDTTARGVPPPVLGVLAERAGERGQLLVLHHCDTEMRLRDALDRARREGADAVLFDPGPLCGGCLREEAAKLAMPVVEVHDDGPPPVEPSMGRGAIHGYGAQGYVLALAVALERLGCDVCRNDVHVGT